MTDLNEIKTLGNPDASFFVSHAKRRSHASEEADRVNFLRAAAGIQGAEVMGPEHLARMAWGAMDSAPGTQPAI